jgi:hypothetical protein
MCTVGGVDVPLGDERDDRRDQGIAKLAGDRFGGGAEDDVVLARDEVRPVLLDAAGRDDRRVLAGPHGVADLHPGHVLHEDGVARRDRTRGIRVGADWVERGGL